VDRLRIRHINLYNHLERVGADLLATRPNNGKPLIIAASLEDSIGCLGRSMPQPSQ
jgi:hypothetical protein